MRTLDALHLAIASDNALQLVTSDKTVFQAASMPDVDVRLIAE
jgi:predicted nucleic acid-binding protein